MAEENWAGNYIFRASYLHRPSSVDEVRRIVANATAARALGTRHSFNSLADTSGDLVDLSGLVSSPVVDPERRTVSVAAGTRYGTLATALQSMGWALHNMGSLPHISVAGATATGTHGSGDANGNLSTAVSAIELVTEDGGLQEVRRAEDGFAGMVVGLGAFGIVTRLTLDIQPSFDVRQDAFAELPWPVLIARFDEIMAAAYSVSIMTTWSGPTVGRLWLKTRIEDGQPLAVTADHLSATAVPHAMATGHDETSATLTEFGTPGVWSERLPHFRLDRDPGRLEQIQSEYMVPRKHARAALEAVRSIAERVDALLYMTEIRTMAADGLWLSPSQGADTAALHFTWRREPAAVDAITAEIEEMLLPLGARPHWGKVMHADAARLAGVYPYLDQFRALANRYDPRGKFRNDFLCRHVFG